MAKDLKISLMPKASIIKGNELIPIVLDNQNKTITINDISTEEIEISEQLPTDENTKLWIDTATSGDNIKIPDAPNDGNTYGRKSGLWEIIPKGVDAYNKQEIDLKLMKTTQDISDLTERINSTEGSIENLDNLHIRGTELFGGIETGTITVEDASAPDKVPVGDIIFYKTRFVFRSNGKYFSSSLSADDYNSVKASVFTARTDKYFIQEDKQYYFNGTTLVLLRMQDAPKDGKQYSRKDGAWEAIQKDPNVLVKTKQSLSEAEQTQVQTNIGVKNTVDLVGAGTPTKVTEVWKKDNWRAIGGAIYGTPGITTYKALKVSIGDVLIGKAKGTVNMSVVSKVDGSNNFIQTIIKGTNQEEQINYVINFNGYIEISAVEYLLNLSIIPCKLASALTPLGGPNRKLYEAAGATFNEETGFYELNGLTDITEEEMADIITDGTSYITDHVGDSLTKGRTNMRIPYGFILGGSMIRNAKHLEVLNIVTWNNINDSRASITCISNISYAFYICSKLHTILGVIDISNVTQSIKFCNDTKIKNIKLKGLKNNFTIDTGVLSKDSLKYLIDNSINSSAITVTLHADVYAKVASAEAEWGDIYTSAQTKLISFAQG